MEDEKYPRYFLIVILLSIFSSLYLIVNLIIPVIQFGLASVDFMLYVFLGVLPLIISAIYVFSSSRLPLLRIATIITMVISYILLSAVFVTII